MATIADVERALEREFEKISEKLQELGLMPKGFRCSARLQGEFRDKKRNASFEKSWSPETDSIRIEFERTQEHPVSSPERHFNPVNIRGSALSETVLRDRQ